MRHKPRQITEEDLAPLAELWWAGWHEAHAAFVPTELSEQRTLASFQARLKDFGDTVRAIGSLAAPQGFCAIQADQLYQLYVAPAARGTGIAADLLTDGECRLALGGVKRACLLCLPQNTVAARFYARQGWEDCGIKCEKLFGSGGGFELDVIRFEKTLAS